MVKNTKDHSLCNLFERADKFTKVKQFNNAIECYKKIIYIDPTNVDALYLLGDVYIEKGDVESNKEEYLKAIDAYNKIISLNKTKFNLWNAWGGMAESYEKLGDSKKAEKCYDKAYELEKDYIYHLNFVNRTYEKF